MAVPFAVPEEAHFAVVGSLNRTAGLKVPRAGTTQPSPWHEKSSPRTRHQAEALTVSLSLPTGDLRVCMYACMCVCVLTLPAARLDVSDGHTTAKEEANEIITTLHHTRNSRSLWVGFWVCGGCSVRTAKKKKVECTQEHMRPNENTSYHTVCSYCCQSGETEEGGFDLSPPPPPPSVSFTHGNMNRKRRHLYKKSNVGNTHHL